VTLRSSSLFQVGENEEVTIKQVADAIVKAVGFEGEYSVRISPDFGKFIQSFSSIV
jgi:GDP-L-fucose synthase